MKLGKGLLIGILVFSLAFLPLVPSIDQRLLGGGSWTVYLIRSCVELACIAGGMWMGYMAKEIDVIKKYRKKGILK